MKIKNSHYLAAEVLMITLLLANNAFASDDSFLDAVEENERVVDIPTVSGSEANATKINEQDSQTVQQASIGDKALSEQADETVDDKTIGAGQEPESQLRVDNSKTIESQTTSESLSGEASTLTPTSEQASTAEKTDAEHTALSILGNSVEPGEAAILQWEFAAAFADSSSASPVLVANGVNPGPTLCLTAAVHGDELNGIEIVRRTVHAIDTKKLSGTVIGVPIVNVQGFRRASRYLPDRRDLNRYFPGRAKGSYASRFAFSLFNNVIAHCDYLIDIHTGSLSRTNLPQIRANLSDPEVASLAEKMGSIVLVQSKGAKGTLRRAAVEAGIPAVTVETGGPNNLQKEAVETGVKSILSALSSLGLSPSPKPFWKRSAEPAFYKSTWIRANSSGILFSKVELGDSVKKDSVLGLITDPASNMSSEITAPFDGRVIGMALNQVMYPGYAAYHIGLKSSIKEAANQTPTLDQEELHEPSDLSSEQAPNINQLEVELANPDTTAPVKLEKEPLENMELPLSLIHI